MVKLPRSYRLDWAALRNDAITAWIEMKRRYRTFDQYDDTFLSLHKMIAAKELNAHTGLRCLFAVQFDDCLAYADLLDDFDWKITFGGRTDRGDWQDVEPIVLIPMRAFTILESISDPTKEPVNERSESSECRA